MASCILVKTIRSVRPFRSSECSMDANPQLEPHRYYHSVGVPRHVPENIIVDSWAFSLLANRQGFC